MPILFCNHLDIGQLSHSQNKHSTRQSQGLFRNGNAYVGVRQYDLVKTYVNLNKTAYASNINCFGVEKIKKNLKSIHVTY